MNHDKVFSYNGPGTHCRGDEDSQGEAEVRNAQACSGRVCAQSPLEGFVELHKVGFGEVASQGVYRGLAQSNYRKDLVRKVQEKGILLDTSVWIRYLYPQGYRELKFEVEKTLAAGLVFTCWVVKAELLVGGEKEVVK